MNEYLSAKIKFISFISIVMVIYLHAFNLTTKFVGKTETLQGKDINSFVQEFISNGVARIAVPLFFLISGYLFFLNFRPTVSNFITKYKKRLFSLVIPFMFWSTWGVIFYWTMQSIPLSSSFFINELVKNYSIMKVIDTIFIHPIPYQLWFLIDLIKYVAISPIIYIYLSKFSYYSLIPFLVSWFFNINLVFVSSEGLLFFLICCLFAIKQFNLNHIKVGKNYRAYIIFFIWICILLIKTYFSFSDAYFVNYFHKISIIIGIFAVWIIYDVWVSSQIKQTKIFQLTDFTFFIFASHEPILTIIKKGMLKIMGVGSYSNLIVYLISPILTLGIIMIIGLLLRHYTPQFYSVITGGRLNKKNMKRELSIINIIE
jgi:surface polysaccharide O-acyltransferase-like enzyme